jgi:hypothetical protein
MLLTRRNYRGAFFKAFIPLSHCQRHKIDFHKEREETYGGEIGYQTHNAALKEYRHLGGTYTCIIREEKRQKVAKDA